MLRQLHFSLVDIVLHHNYDPNSEETPNQVREANRHNQRSVMPPLALMIPSYVLLAIFLRGDMLLATTAINGLRYSVLMPFAAFEEAGLEDEMAMV